MSWSIRFVANLAELVALKAAAFILFKEDNMSKKVTLSADGATATVVDATVGDIFATALTTNSAVTGTYGFVQKGLFFAAGMITQNIRVGRSWNIFSA